MFAGKDWRALNRLVQTNAEHSTDFNAEVERLTGLWKARQERANVLRAELGQVEGEIRRLESAIEALQGSRKSSSNVDPLRSARARWAQARRRRKPKAEQDRLKWEYETLKKKS
jgi:chromosome segregation ATPase